MLKKSHIVFFVLVCLASISGLVITHMNSQPDEQYVMGAKKQIIISPELIEQGNYNLILDDDGSVLPIVEAEEAEVNTDGNKVLGTSTKRVKSDSISINFNPTVKTTTATISIKEN